MIGPFLIYCNSGADHDKLWKDALAKAAKEAERVALRLGSRRRLSDKEPARHGDRYDRSLKDPLTPMSKVSNMLVGMTPQSATGRPIDWQLDAKYYQFWVRADEQGQLYDPQCSAWNVHAARHRRRRAGRVQQG